MAAAMTRVFSRSVSRTAHPAQQRLRSSKAHLIELDLEGEGAEGAGSGIRRLEDVLQSIMARRAAPDWLPFLPGYSYYVPPPPSTRNLIHLLGTLSNANSKTNSAPTDLSTDRTWPSSAYFIQGTAPTHPLPMGSVVEVNLYECDGDEAPQESSSEEE